MADIALDVQSAPTTPAAGVSVEYVDSTTKTIRSKDDAGTVHHYLDAASAGVTGVLKGNGTGPVTAIALPSDATKFLDGTGAFSAPATSSLGSIVNEFRLSLTSGTSVTTTDVTAATTLYLTPHVGRRMTTFDGSGNATTLTSAEINIAVPASTSQVYDAFVYSNSGTLTLELLAWTNDTTRATAIIKTGAIDAAGVWTKSGDTTRRYVGSVRTTTVSGQTEDSYAKRYLFNYFYAMDRVSRALESAASWSYGTPTIRQANGASTNQADIVIGVAESAVSVQVSAGVQPGSASNIKIGIGKDSTTTFASGSLFGSTAVVTGKLQFQSVLHEEPTLGRHTYTWLEYAESGSTFYGTDSAYQQSGLVCRYRG